MTEQQEDKKMKTQKDKNEKRQKHKKKIKKTKRLKDLIANQMFLDNDEPSRMPLYIFRIPSHFPRQTCFKHLFTSMYVYFEFSLNFGEICFPKYILVSSPKRHFPKMTVVLGEMFFTHQYLFIVF